MNFMLKNIVVSIGIFISQSNAQDSERHNNRSPPPSTQPLKISIQQEHSSTDMRTRDLEALYKYSQEANEKKRENQSKSMPVVPTHEFFKPPRNDSSDYGPSLSDYERIKPTISTDPSDEANFQDQSFDSPKLTDEWIKDWIHNDELKHHAEKNENLNRVGIILRETVPLGAGTGIGAAGYFYGTLIATSSIAPAFLLAGVLGASAYAGLRLGAGELLQNSPHLLSEWIDELFDQKIKPTLTLTPECNTN